MAVRNDGLVSCTSTATAACALLHLGRIPDKHVDRRHLPADSSKDDIVASVLAKALLFAQGLVGTQLLPFAESPQ